MAGTTVTPQVKNCTIKVSDDRLTIVDASGEHTYPVTLASSLDPRVVVNTFGPMIESVLQHSASHSHQDAQAGLNVLLAHQSASRGVVFGGKDGQLSLTSWQLGKTNS